MKKRVVYVTAWLLLVALLCAPMRLSVEAKAEETEKNIILIAPKPSEKVLYLDDAMAENGLIVVDGGSWDKIIAPGNLKTEKIILQGTSTGVLEVESGRKCELTLDGVKIEEFVLTAPQTTNLGVLSKTIGVKVSVKTQNNTEITQTVVGGTAELDFAGAKVGSVEIETKDAYCILAADIKNYEGSIEVNQNNTRGSVQVGLQVSDSIISELAITGNSGRCTVSGDATIDTMLVEAATKIILHSGVENLIVSEEAAEAELKLYAEVCELTVQADKSKFALAENARIEKAAVEGDTVKIYGYGKLEWATITGGEANVSVKGAEVEGNNDTSRPPEMDQMREPVVQGGKPKPTPTPESTDTPEDDTVVVTSPSGIVLHIEFNEQGQMTLQKRYTADGTYIGYNQFYYVDDSEDDYTVYDIACFDTEDNIVGSVDCFGSESLGLYQEHYRKYQDNVEVVLNVTRDENGVVTEVEFAPFEEIGGRVNSYKDGVLNFYILYQYDEHNREIERKTYTPEGVAYIWYTSENTYYEDGTVKIVEYKENLDAESAEERYITEVIYEDAEGNVVRHEQYEEGTISLVHEYNAEGEVTKTFWYNTNGDIRSYYEFNEQQSLVLEKQYSYDANGDLIGYTVTEYDENENVVKVTNYDANGNVVTA